MEEILICFACRDTFKDPKALPCLHSFCKSCLESVVANKTSFPCPLCRQITQVPEKGVNGFQANFWAKGLIDQVNAKSQAKVSCSHCEDIALFKCQDCGELLCDFCHQSHKRQNRTSTHQVNPLPGHVVLQKSFKCSKHQEDLKLFCESCNLPICKDCGLLDHKTHNFAFLSELSQKQKDSVAVAMKESKAHVGVAKESLDKVNLVIQQINTRSGTVAQKITKMIDQMMKALEDRKKGLLDDLEKIKTEKMKKLLGQKEELEINLSSINASIAFVEGAFQSGLDVEILSMKGAMMKRLKELNQGDYKQLPKEDDQFDFGGDIDNIVQQIKQFGTIISSSASERTSHLQGWKNKLSTKAWQCILVVCDGQGKLKKMGGDDVKAVLESPSGQVKAVVQDNNNGQYAIKGEFPNEGEYKLVVTLNGRELQGGPFLAKFQKEASEECKMYLTKIGAYTLLANDLKTLDLHGKKLGDEGWKFIGEALQLNTALTSLNLNGCGISAEGIRFIAESLKNNTGLTSLHLNNNEIGAEGMKWLATALKTNTALTTVFLNANKVGPDGAKHLAEALKSNNSLTSLEFHTNNIGDDGCRAILDSFKSNTSITLINLNTNAIGDKAAKSISEALKNNTTLLSLYLYDNQIGTEGAKYFADALKNNTTLTTLDLQFNKLGQAEKNYLNRFKSPKLQIWI